MSHDHPYLVATLDLSALVALIGAHAGFFPALAAFLASIWYLIQIVAYLRGKR